MTRSDGPQIDPDHHPLRLASRSGYGRPKPDSAWISQAVWLVAGLASLLFLTNPTHMILGILLPLIALGSIVWIEWSERCEDQSKVNKVFAAIMVVLAFFIVRNHNERGRQ